jgi:hypothetical protein
MTAESILPSFREAFVTTLAAVATMLCALAIDPEPGPAIMAVVLGLSLSRSHLDLDARGRWEAAFALPVVSLAALAVGALLHRAPGLGAFAFVAGMSLAIWLRRFGPLVRRAGSLIALPFVVILTTPYVPTTRLGPVMTLCMPVIVAELALAWVAIGHLIARRRGWLAPVRADIAVVPHTVRDGTLRPMASTRMAIQMAVALAAAFVVGFVFFPERWPWLVLTAYIVGSGNQGRLDVAYKSVLRVLGAAAGTVAAVAFAFHAGSHDVATVVLILVAVFLGVWLRPFGYAWWALFVTLALSLLQGFEGTSAQHSLWLRLEEIVIGAIIAVASAWIVLPVRSTDVMRRRVADVLAILGDAIDPATPTRAADEWNGAIERVAKVAPAFRASRMLTRWHRAVQPADWADAVLAYREPALSLFSSGGSSSALRIAVGTARKAMRDPERIRAALEDVRRLLMSDDATAASSAPETRAAG